MERNIDYKKYVKYKKKYLQLKGGALQDNEHCIADIATNPTPFVRNPMCTKDSTGYQIINLAKYIIEQNFEKNIKNINGNRYLKVYRGDLKEKYNKNPLNFTRLYNKRMDDYFLHNDNSAIGYGIRPPNYIGKNGINGWGQEPSIGINTSTLLNTAQGYGAYNVRMYGIDKTGYTIFTFYIKIDETNILQVAENCLWSQITCDNTANTTYDLIGYMNKNADINIIDKGRQKIYFITSELYDVNDNLVNNSTIQVFPDPNPPPPNYDPNPNPPPPPNYDPNPPPPNYDPNPPHIALQDHPSYTFIPDPPRTDGPLPHNYEPNPPPISHPDRHPPPISRPHRPPPPISHPDRPPPHISRPDRPPSPTHRPPPHPPSFYFSHPDRPPHPISRPDRPPHPISHPDRPPPHISRPDRPPHPISHPDRPHSPTHRPPPHPPTHRPPPLERNNRSRSSSTVLNL